MDPNTDALCAMLEASIANFERWARKTEAKCAYHEARLLKLRNKQAAHLAVFDATVRRHEALMRDLVLRAAGRGIAPSTIWPPRWWGVMYEDDEPARD